VKVVAFVGDSGSGKTTAIAALTRHFAGRGQRVGAIKHTHHAVNDEDRGDSAEFRRSGANPVILAGNGDAVVFSGDAKSNIRFTSARELLSYVDTDIVFVEGFKSFDAWPRIELKGHERRTLSELLAILDGIWRP
jgi:molybdopterin-guanine dinucleotide biosynthesis protein MobB